MYCGGLMEGKQKGFGFKKNIDWKGDGKTPAGNWSHGLDTLRIKEQLNCYVLG